MANSSFEEYDVWEEIPSLYRPIGWQMWNGTPDYFSAVIIPETPGDSLWWVPRNGFSYQWPADGEAYMGLYAFGSISPHDFREILGAELFSPLTVGETYSVSFQVSLAVEGYYWHMNWACNMLGAYFTMQGYDWEDDPLELPDFAHVYEEDIIVDTIGWVTIAGSFMADQPYTHVGIGGFYSHEFVDTLHYTGVPSLGAYYYVDAISVTSDPSDISDWSTANDPLRVWPNPAVEIANVTTTGAWDELLIRNMSGRTVRNYGKGSGAIVLDVSELPRGIYLIELKQEKSIHRKKLVLCR